MILGIETSCDETAAALVTPEGEIRSNVVSSQAELHARYGGVVPEVASRRHLELVSPVIAEALSAGGATRSTTSRLVAVTQGPGLVGALLVGPERGEGARMGTPPAARARRPPAGSRRVALSRAGPRRAAVPLPACERRPHAAPRRRGSRGLPRARHLDRRRGRRGVRQGRAAARPRLPRRRRDRPAGAGGRPRGVRVPGRAGRRARLLVLGRQDRAPVRDARSRRRSSRRAAQTSRRPTSARSCARSSSDFVLLQHKLAGPRSRSWAASPPTPSSAPRSRTRASHRSRSAPTTRR